MRPVCLPQWRWRACLAMGWLAISLLLLNNHALAAVRRDAGELQVKAAYLIKFANYVEWPAGSFDDAGSPVVIGVMAADGLADELQSLVVGQSAHGRRFIVRRLQPGEALTGVHVLFLGPMPAATLGATLAQARSLPVLTVADSRTAQMRGCMINFVVQGERLRFEVTLQPAGSRQLKLSALMLTAATRVVRGEP